MASAPATPMENCNPSPATGKVVVQEETTHADGSKGAVSSTSGDNMLSHIVVRDAAAALTWYCAALQGRVTFRYDESATGRVMYAVVKSSYGFSVVVEDDFGHNEMVPAAADEGAAGPKGSIYFYVMLQGEVKTTCDEAVQRMKDEGAVVVCEPKDMFYGHRMGRVVDVWGVCWCFAHRLDPEKQPGATGATGHAANGADAAAADGGAGGGDNAKAATS